MQRIKDYFKNRPIRFYAALGTAALSVVTAVVYAATLGHLGEFVSWAPFALLLVGALVFAAASVFEMPRIGAAVMAGMDFIAFLVYVGTIYRYPMSLTMVVASIDEIAEMPAIVVNAVLMVVCIAAANVCAWLRLGARKGGTETPVADGTEVGK